MLQNNHVVAACWLNHSGGATAQIYRAGRAPLHQPGYGHFHLGQDYQDSIGVSVRGPERGPLPEPRRLRPRADGGHARRRVARRRQQSRLIRGDEKGFEICTIEYKRGGIVRLDATMLHGQNHGSASTRTATTRSTRWAATFARLLADGGRRVFVDYDNDGYLDATESTCVDGQTIAWWKLSCGRVLGVYDGRLIEYDLSTLAPLGLVVGQDELAGRRIVVVPTARSRARSRPTAAARSPTARRS